MVSFLSELVRFVRGRNECTQLIVRNHLFRKNQCTRYKNRMYWQCTYYIKGDCRVRCVTTDNGEIISKDLNHYHEPDARINSFPVIEEIVLVRKRSKFDVD